MAKQLSNGHAAKANGTQNNSIMNQAGKRHASLRGVDVLFLLLGRAVPSFNPVCTSTYTFDKEIDVEDLREVIQKQCKIFPKYRQRLAIKNKFFSPPFYEDDPDWSLDRHFEVVTLPEPAGPKELNDFVSSYIRKSWDESKPLWSVAYIPNYSDGSNAKSAMVSKGHHAQADGQGFILSQLYVTSYGEDLQTMMDEGTAKLHDARFGTLPPDEVSPYLRHLRPLWDVSWLRPILGLIFFSLYWAMELGNCAVRLLWSFLHFFYMAYFLAITIWRIDTVVPVRPGPREVAFTTSKGLKLSDVKTMQRAFSGSIPGKSQSGTLGHDHVTVNDVLCAIMADVVSLAIQRKKESGLLQWAKSVVGFLYPMPVAFFIPISLRDPGQWDMRNLSTGTLAYLSHLPQAKPTIHQIHKHIHKCKTSLNFSKRSYLPVWAFHLLQILGQFPFIFYPIWADSGIFTTWPFVALKEAIVGRILTSMPAILTNIPGPPESAELAGSTILRWTALPPQGGKGTAAIGIITYNGIVSITIAVDMVSGYEDAADLMCHDFQQRFSLYLKAAESTLDDRP